MKRKYQKSPEIKKLKVVALFKNVSRCSLSVLTEKRSFKHNINGMSESILYSS